MRFLCFLVASALLMLVPALPASATPMFMGIGDSPVESSYAADVSADGSVVTGGATTASGNEAFRWTFEGGMERLGNLQGANPPGKYGDGHAISADGSAIVGRDTSTSGTEEAMRWTQSEGMVALGQISPGGFDSVAFDVSSDGDVIAGYFRPTPTSNQEAFRWTLEVGMQGLGDLPGGSDVSLAFGISGDGSVVVGNSISASGLEAFLWTEATGIVGLGDLPGGDFSSSARAVSSDGSTIVGFGKSSGDASQSSIGREAFRWTQQTEMVGLGEPPGGDSNSVAFDVSADGSTIVGRSLIPDPGAIGAEDYRAFIWNDETGMVILQDLLANDLGLDLTGWHLTVAQGISDDGYTIVGTGINPLGQPEAWIATIPEPTTALLLATGLAGLAAAGRRRSLH